MKKLENCRSGKDLVHHAMCSNELQSFRQVGSHWIGRTAKGVVVIPNKPGDLGTGIRAKIIKIMIAIGLGIFLIAAFFGG